MREERRQENNLKESRIKERIDQITDQEVDDEVRRLWNVQGLSGKRKRISKNDRDNAKKMINFVPSFKYFH